MPNPDLPAEMKPVQDQEGISPSFLRRHRWLIWLSGALLVVLAALAVTAAVLIRRAEPFLHAQIVDSLSRHFHARVELDSFHVSLVKGIEAEGKGLRIWPPAQIAGVEVPEGKGAPLIDLEEFHFHAPLHFKSGEPVHVRRVVLKGLNIDVPPRLRPGHDTAPAGNPSITSAPAMPASNASPQPSSPELSPQSSHVIGKSKWLSFLVDSVECTDTTLVLETSKPGKLPLTFQIAKLKLTEIDPHAAMKFEAELTNPRPVGTIKTTGSFGPWVRDDPGESQVSGDYKFEHADLATFKGIAGILNSTGRYQGTLRDLTVDGVTDMADFRLTGFDNPLPLHTKFHALVDGTNGDTRLDPVEATLGHSHFTAAGPIVHVTAQGDGKLHPAGHDIALKVNVDRAHIEDFLMLAGKSGTPLLTGDVKVKTTLHIPPGPEPVHKRLALDGEFHLDQVRFTSEKIQDRIRELSLRGQGHPGEVKKTDPAAIESEMDGRFSMADGVITLPQLEYSVPGAQVDLTGAYTLEGGGISFTGKARTQATVSQMVGGWKGLLLKPADRFFKKDGAGTEVPVHVSGTREHPDFGIDLGKMKTTSPEKPGEKQQ